MSSTLNPPGQESFNEVLIKTVRNYPSLYVNNRRVYENIDRNLVWVEVAKKIGRQVTPEFAKKRWLQLRDRYRKELKIAISQGFTLPHRWSHFHLLQWLDPYLQGSLSSTAREYQDNVDTSLQTSEKYSFSNSSLLSLANNLFNTQDGLEKLESCGSELLDDVKPSLSTMQSVLAAAEASAKAAAAACDKSAVDDLSSGPNIVEMFDQVKQNALVALGSEYPRIEIDENPFSVGPTSSENSTTSSSGKPPLLEQEEQSPKIFQKYYPTFSFRSHRNGYRTKSHSNLLRTKFRKRLKKSMPLPSQQQLEKTPESNVVSTSCLNCAPGMMASWFDDEEMLFARIVGLRLKKMCASKRKAARLRISQVLDDEEMHFDGCNETGTSVAE